MMIRQSMRSPIFTFTIAALVCLLGLPTPAAAQDPQQPLNLASIDFLAAPLAASTPSDEWRAASTPRRPAAMLPLYMTFAALQVLDTHSTSAALGRGAVETNPLVRPFADNELGLIAVKAAGTAGVIFASEQLWKKNKTAAIAFMLATNAAMTWVVQHNYRAAR
jgi:hypothetical protein